MRKGGGIGIIEKSMAGMLGWKHDCEPIFK